ncbi:MAG: sugar lactone lactonase YvrE [Nonlabens sp.]|jgi:sugar lactone lactonase YvrE
MSVKHFLFLLISVSLFFACGNSNPETEPKTETAKPSPMDPTKAVLEYKTKAQLGEGALWNYKTQEFYWVDIEGKQLHIYNPKTKKNRSFLTPSRIGTVVASGHQEAMIALEDGIYKLNLRTRSLSLFVAVESDQPENRFNDGKCDPAGRLWVGSMHLDQTPNAANLWKIDKDGTSTKMLDNITISNGIVWTKDKKTMYYTDTPTGVIRAFDYDVTLGTIANGRVAVTVPESLGYPDGMTIDENDQLWVGLWNGNAVAHFDPITGKLLSKIEVPAHNVTACAFGGRNLDTLYITTASVDMTEKELLQYPDAGSVFMTVPGVKGVPSTFFGEGD